MDVYEISSNLCSDHFQESQYNFPLLIKSWSFVWDAVGTIFSIPCPPSKIDNLQLLDYNLCSEKRVRISTELE